MRQSASLLSCGAIVACSLLLTSGTALGQKSATTVKRPASFAVSQPVRELPVDWWGLGDVAVPELPRPSLKPNAGLGAVGPDPVLQQEVLPMVAATQGIDFDGIGALGVLPSDANLAVGPNHIVQTVNSRLAVYDKTGTLLSGPTSFNAFFAPLGGDCARFHVNPIVTYDRLADRWVISTVGYTTSGGNLSTSSECVAVSQTSDPAGEYTLYGYSFGAQFVDFPKIGVWPTASSSAYLASHNLFSLPSQTYQGVDLCAFDRAEMLAGNPGPLLLCVTTPTSEYGYLPSDLDGPTPPADGTPGLFLSWHDNTHLYLRRLTIGFSAGSGFVTVSPTIPIDVPNSLLTCGNSGGRCVPQPGTTVLLETIGRFLLMNRMPFRMFPDHERVVVNHSVDAGGRTGIRWYELLDLSTTPTVNQQGTFSPDATHRWVASIAMDKVNNIAMGYSASSASVFPAIRFTGRVPSDPAGTLETEGSIVEGGGSQTFSSGPWGYYTGLQVDPSDDCTFWYTNQYYTVTSSFNWSTRIGSFVFPSCGAPAVAFSPGTLNFKKLPIGQFSAPKTVTLTNTGATTLHISSIATVGEFDLWDTTCGLIVAAGASCDVSVIFGPTAKGNRKGTLTFTDDAADSPQAVSLMGVGQSIVLSPTSLNFGTVAVGNLSSQQTVTISNVGPATVKFTGFALAGTAAGDYQISANTCGATIGPGTNCSVGIRFRPTKTGKRNAKLNVKNNGGGSPSSVNLTGVGN